MLQFNTHMNQLHSTGWLNSHVLTLNDFDEDQVYMLKVLNRPVNWRRSQQSLKTWFRYV